MKNRSYMQALVDKRVAIGLFIWWLINLLQAAFTELAHDEAYYFMSVSYTHLTLPTKHAV